MARNSGSNPRNPFIADTTEGRRRHQDLHLLRASCPYRKLKFEVLMVYPAQDRHCKHAADALDLARDRRVFVQRQVDADLVVISLIRVEQNGAGAGPSPPAAARPRPRGEARRAPARSRDRRSPKTTTWSRQSRRIDPMSLSAYPFCHGERAAVGRSWMPMALTRRMNAGPHGIPLRAGYRVQSPARSRLRGSHLKGE
jgi:hypothetical protein